MRELDDWRLASNKDYLLGVTLTWKAYRAPRPDWDHDHCAFCGAKFMDCDVPDVLKHGYATENEYDWVCRPCFDDFEDLFGWNVVRT